MILEYHREKAGHRRINQKRRSLLNARSARQTEANLGSKDSERQIDSRDLPPTKTDQRYTIETTETIGAHNDRYASRLITPEETSAVPALAIETILPRLS
jgi:hypothetical protein